MSTMAFRSIQQSRHSAPLSAGGEFRRLSTGGDIEWYGPRRKEFRSIHHAAEMAFRSTVREGYSQIICRSIVDRRRESRSTSAGGGVQEHCSGSASRTTLHTSHSGVSSREGFQEYTRRRRNSGLQITPVTKDTVGTEGGRLIPNLGFYRRDLLPVCYGGTEGCVSITNICLYRVRL